MRAHRLGLLSLTLVACSDQGDTQSTLPKDAAADAVSEAGSDAGLDATTDANADAQADAGGARRVLLFSKTAEFRHTSIEKAGATLGALAAARDWSVTPSEDAGVFSDAALADFDVVVFLMTSGDILTAPQQAAFERFIQGGGGFVGVHSATDTEYDWAWYGKLVGAYFSSHPAVQSGDLIVERGGHLATHHLPLTWTRADEYYSFQASPRAGVHVLVSLDESSYSPGGSAMGADHPIAWYQYFDGGRAFYTALGHTEASWDEAAFVTHVAGGIDWALGRSWDKTIVADFDGRPSPGSWQPHSGPGAFQFEVSADHLKMFDLGGANQHLVRSGVSVTPGRPYAVETLFRIHGPGGAASGLNSFALNLNVAGLAADLGPPSTWAMNLDVPPSTPGGVMKHMGFVAGGFAEIGQTPVTWGKKDIEYLFRVNVHAKLDGSPAPNFVSVRIFETAQLRQSFEVDYQAFPHQPSATQPTRLGVNTHGTDWTMRGYGAYYLD
jgi:type 1 glutamine amidotransferase